MTSWEPGDASELLEEVVGGNGIVAYALKKPGIFFIGCRLPAGQLLDMRADATAIGRRLARVLS